MEMTANENMMKTCIAPSSITTISGTENASSAAPNGDGDTAGQTALSKPTRPLSAYNLFFRDEREKLLQSLPRMKAPRGHSKRRNPHHKIGFADLARTVAARWRNLNPVVKGKYEETAKIEKSIYKERAAAWRKQQENLGLPTQPAKQRKPAKNPSKNPEPIVTKNPNKFAEHGSISCNLGPRQFDVSGHDRRVPRDYATLDGIKAHGAQQSQVGSDLALGQAMVQQMETQKNAASWKHHHCLPADDTGPEELNNFARLSNLEQDMEPLQFIPDEQEHRMSTEVVPLRIFRCPEALECQAEPDAHFDPANVQSVGGMRYDMGYGSMDPCMDRAGSSAARMSRNCGHRLFGEQSVQTGQSSSMPRLSHMTPWNDPHPIQLPFASHDNPRAMNGMPVGDTSCFPFTPSCSNSAPYGMENTGLAPQPLVASQWTMDSSETASSTLAPFYEYSSQDIGYTDQH